jgi:hypothetical protein
LAEPEVDDSSEMENKPVESDEADSARPPEEIELG